MKIQLNTDASADGSSSVRPESQRPSRLVNMKVRDADLIASRTAEMALQQAKEKEVTVTVTKEQTKEIGGQPDGVEQPADAEAREQKAEPVAEKEVPNTEDKGLMVVPKGGSLKVMDVPVDEIARTVSEAIATIRSATDPLTVASQIASLKKFAGTLRKESKLPEITELADTIDKFVTVAEKSSAAKLERRKSILAAKAEQAKKAQAAKLAAEQAVPVQKATATKSATKVATGASKPAARRVSRATARVSDAKVRRATQKTQRVASRTTRATEREIQRAAKTSDAAVKNAIRAAEREERMKKLAMEPRGGGKRFVLAFACAIVCIAGIVWAVASNIPDISVRVAAMQVGIEASYPSYIPQAFSLKGISSADSKITLTFRDAKDNTFTIVEEKSSWDSAALERNYAIPTWHDAYTTTREQGLTIYTAGSSAAWVNGGVLFKIDAKSGLITKKQLKNIITSM